MIFLFSVVKRELCLRLENNTHSLFVSRLISSESN